MKKKILIITGGTKGLGNGLLKVYKSRGFEIHSLARTIDASLDNEGVFQYPFDLENIPQIQNLLDSIFERYLTTTIEKITLINNAGILGEIGPLETVSSTNIQTVIDVNLTAPMVLTSKFISLTQDIEAEKTIINISSGAARRPYHGWVPYCTTKAAIEMLTRGVAKEQEGKEFPICSIAIVPGVVETGMQEEIRKVSKDRFPSVSRFIELKEKGQLSDPMDIASKIYEVDVDSGKQNGDIISVREN